MLFARQYFLQSGSGALNIGIFGGSFSRKRRILFSWAHSSSLGPQRCSLLSGNRAVTLQNESHSSARATRVVAHCRFVASATLFPRVAQVRATAFCAFPSSLVPRTPKWLLLFSFWWFSNSVRPQATLHSIHYPGLPLQFVFCWNLVAQWFCSRRNAEPTLTP